MARSPRNEEAPLPINGQPESDPSPLQVLLYKRALQVKDKAKVQLPEDDDFRLQYPKLWELLQPQRFRIEDEEYDRASAPYAVEMTAGGWRITFRDAVLGFSISAFSAKHSDCLKALEACACDPATWIHYKSRGKKLRKVSRS